MNCPAPFPTTEPSTTSAMENRTSTIDTPIISGRLWYELHAGCIIIFFITDNQSMTTSSPLTSNQSNSGVIAAVLVILLLLVVLTVVVTVIAVVVIKNRWKGKTLSMRSTRHPMSVQNGPAISKFAVLHYD